MSRVPLTVREDLQGLAPYVSPQQPARYRMNTNESPYAPPEALVDEVTEELRQVALNRYPDRDASSLVEAIATHVGRARDEVWVANGSNEVFLHLFLAFGGRGRAAAVFTPTYTLHSLIPKIGATRVVELPRTAEYEADLDAAVAAFARERPDVVILCSPNNPTGNPEPVAAVRALLAETGGIVVVDEAYGEFGDPTDSVVPLLDEHPNLVVTKTFSKAWRLAGIRIGYMLASSSFIAELARVRLPYHLSSVTQIVGRAALRHSGDTLELAGAIAAERDRIAVGLQALGVKAYPSKANFVLFEVDDPERVWTMLLERGVLVRNYAGTPRLEGCLRVTAGLPDETDAFMAALEEVLDA